MTQLSSISNCDTTLSGETPNIENANEKILSPFNEFEGQGSGWIIDEILHLEVNTSVYNPLGAASYIPLPKGLLQTKSIMNIQDNACPCQNLCLFRNLLSGSSAITPFSTIPNTHPRNHGKILSNSRGGRVKQAHTRRSLTPCCAPDL
ncbi:hypothetical protein JTE90_005615 [Oedothorax gibbosus]|uniref:Uncharacterized protein n=1 Tax=Oedothorax gibbosus TaxID=931172 RepID=A0AAV6U3F1_9ARAC|nr:hypothetical protein JTE90_005615 [Oedothorax gibbosus]